MMLRTGFAATVLLFGVASALSVTAAESVSNQDAKAIRTQQAQIRMNAETRVGIYKDLSEAKRQDLFQRQSIVQRLTADVASTNELSESDQMELFNQLEAIEAIVNSAEDDRMVCQRIKPVGSHRNQTICKTVAQRRAEREAAQNGVNSCFNQPVGKCL